MKISVIVPVFNTKDYIVKCLESLVNQTINNYEIIVVNDGSTDSSLEIIKKYAKKYPNLIRFYDKENEGLAKTRNFGIKHAVGEYISFIDSDDWIDPDMLEKMYNKAKSKNFDVVACDVKYIYETYQIKVSCNIKEDIFDEENLKKVMLNIYPTACNKIYKKTIFDKILFKDDNIKYEDVEFTYRLFLHIKSIGVIKEGLYNYLQRENAITSTFNDKIFDYIINLNSIVEYYKKNNKYNFYYKELEYVYVRYIYASMIRDMTNFTDKNKFNYGVKEARKNVKQQFPNYRFNRYFFTNLKGIYLILFCPFVANLYYFFKKITKK